MIVCERRARHALRACVFVLAAAGCHALAEAGDEGHEHSRHHVEATFGAAFHDGETATFIGYEYEFRIGQRFGVGAFVDTTFSGFDLSAYGAVANFHPGGHWKVLTGLGVERKIGGDKDKLLARVGGAYEFKLGNGTIAPLLVYDFLEDAKDVAYVGVAIGFGF